MELLRICGFCLTALVLIVLLKQYLPVYAAVAALAAALGLLAVISGWLGPFLHWIQNLPDFPQSENFKYLLKAAGDRTGQPMLTGALPGRRAGGAGLCRRFGRPVPGAADGPANDAARAGCAAGAAAMKRIEKKRKEDALFGAAAVWKRRTLHLPPMRHLMKKRCGPMAVQDFLPGCRGLSMETLLEKFAEVVRSQAVEPLKLFARLAAVLFFVCRNFRLCQRRNMWAKTGAGRLYLLAGRFADSAPAGTSGDEVLQCAVYLSGFVPAFAGVLASCGQPSAATLYGGMFWGLQIWRRRRFPARFCRFYRCFWRSTRRPASAAWKECRMRQNCCSKRPNGWSA